MDDEDNYKDIEEISLDRTEEASWVIDSKNDKKEEFSEENLNYFKSLTSQFSQFVQNENEEEEENFQVLTFFKEIVDGFLFFPNILIKIVPNTTFFVDFDLFLRNNIYNYEILGNIFDICYKLIEKEPQYGPLFNGTGLFYNTIVLLDSEFDEVSISAVLLLNQLIKHSLPQKEPIEEIDMLLQKLCSAWRTCEETVEATCEILFNIICNFKYEDDDIEHIVSIFASIMEGLSNKLFLSCNTFMYDSMLYLLDENEKIIILFDEYDLCDFVFRDVNIFDVDQKITEDVENFCLSAIKLIVQLRENPHKDKIKSTNWVVRFPFLIFCIQQLQNAETIEKALYFLKMDLMDDNTELYDKYKRSNLIDDLLELGERQTFSIKQGIIQVIHGMLKHELIPDFYHKLLEFQFLQNYICILEDDTDENNILLLLEIIFMMHQQAIQINDMQSLIDIFDQCNGQEIIGNLTDNENEDIMTHSRELIDIFWPDE